MLPLRFFELADPRRPFGFSQHNFVGDNACVVRPSFCRYTSFLYSLIDEDVSVNGRGFLHLAAGPEP